MSYLRSLQDLYVNKIFSSGDKKSELDGKQI